MKIAIIDTAFTGHHLEYIYGLSSYIRDQKSSICFDLFCDSKIFEYVEDNNLEPISNIENLKIYSNFLDQIKGGRISRYRTAYKHIKTIKNYDKVIFLDINPYLFILSIYAIIKTPKFLFSGIYFNPFLAEKKSNIDTWMRLFILKNISIGFNRSYVFILNDKKAPEILNNLLSTKMFKMLEDPIPSFFYKQSKNNNFDQPKDNLIFTMLGNLHERKGVFQFLKAIESSKSEDKFVFAGKVKSTELERVQQHIKRLIAKGFNIELKNEFLSIKKFTQYLDYTDVVVIPYLSKGASSGILGHAAYRKKPLIAPSKGILSEIIRKYELGITINPYDIKNFACCLNDGSQVIKASNVEKMKKYSEINSYKIFYEKLFE